MTEIFKTTILLASLTGLLLAIGYFIGGNEGMIFFLIISIIMNLGSFWFSDKIAISMAGGKEIKPDQAPNLYADVEELSQKMGIPTPRIYLSSQPQPNAFATGRSPKHSAVCVTQGLLSNLSREEVAGVIAHELAHIKNRDVLTATIAAIIAGVISSLARMALWFGGNNDENRNPLAGLFLLITAPIAAIIIQLAISRSREFAADRKAAETLGTGKGLANALLKIEEIATRNPMDVNQAMSSLYISNPFGRAANAFAKLFSTHPPTAERISRLQSI